MKIQILELRALGKSYKQICEITGCSKGTVSYHCGKGQKEKTKERARKYKKESYISKSVECFKSNRKTREKVKEFQRPRPHINKVSKQKSSFSWRDVISKFGWVPKCYLTGRIINLKCPGTYHFDHIIPRAQGGSTTLDNLGITCKPANQAKHSLTVNEFLALCVEVLRYHGYTIIEP